MAGESDPLLRPCWVYKWCRILNFCFVFKIWLRTCFCLQNWAFFFFFGKAVKNGKETAFQRSLTQFWNKVLMSICAKFGCFPAMPFWDQFTRRNKEHSLRKGQWVSSVSAYLSLIIEQCRHWSIHMEEASFMIPRVWVADTFMANADTLRRQNAQNICKEVVSPVTSDWSPLKVYSDTKATLIFKLFKMKLFRSQRVRASQRSVVHIEAVLT